MTATQASPVRTFVIDGRETTDTTFRTPLVEAFVKVAGRRFVDLGAADGYEARALATRGAGLSLAVEGKESIYRQALDAARIAGLANHEVRQADVRLLDPAAFGTFDCALCFGLLYHMRNPFNLLKRIAHLTDGTLLLETHIAPEPWAEHLLLEKHRGALDPGVRTVLLDGERFEGRLCPHVGAHAVSKGSLDEEWTLWLTGPSLVKALTRAGFEIRHWFHEIDDATPETVAKWGSRLGFGHANSKVFVVARIDPERRQPVVAPTDRLLPPHAVPFEPADFLRRNARRAWRALRRIAGIR